MRTLTILCNYKHGHKKECVEGDTIPLILISHSVIMSLIPHKQITSTQETCYENTVTIFLRSEFSTSSVSYLLILYLKLKRWREKNSNPASYFEEKYIFMSYKFAMEYKLYVSSFSCPCHFFVKFMMFFFSVKCFKSLCVFEKFFTRYSRTRVSIIIVAVSRNPTRSRLGNFVFIFFFRLTLISVFVAPR